MPDDADRADDRIENAKADGISEASRAVAAMPVGEPGECNGCGYYFQRTVGGYCGHCRDKFKELIRGS